MHALPYTASHDWEEFCKSLADIDYKGNFTLEACNFINKFPDEFIPVALKFEYDVAKYIVDKIENYKKINIVQKDLYNATLLIGGLSRYKNYTLRISNLVSNNGRKSDSIKDIRFL